ncbi:MAG: pilus assembly protein PilZ [Spirochaetaceae bacterium]|jgi:hypothetical protein|nr:pilus assembly protein PilZ [Spirochaetaceae bacterium]
MGSGNETEMTGKKIFFLYPSSLIQNEIAWELIQQEYEVYHVRSHEGLRHALRRFPDSIVFINLDDGLSEKDWDAWIRAVTGDPALGEVKIGVLSAANSDDARKKYAQAMRLPCGYTVVDRADVLKTVKQLYVLLLAVDARGRRKYIRATSENETLTTINIPRNGIYYKGVIKDISVVGLSCAFHEDPDLDKNTLCQDMQIKLQSTILKAEAITFGSRMDGLVKIYVFLFTQRIDPDVRIKIRTYIQSTLQAKMNTLIR